jgi:hypothetical protein
MSHAKSTDHNLPEIIKGLQFSCSIATDLLEQYSEGSVWVELANGEKLCETHYWRLASWLAPKAHADLDGSGLALWGDAQPGGWRVCDSDGQSRGNEELERAILRALCERFGLDENAELSRAVRAEVEGWDLDDPTEPTPDEVADSLSLECSDHWAVGLVCDVPCLVWHENEETRLAWHADEADARRVAETCESRIKAALQALNAE